MAQSLSQFAQSALDIQDACNAPAVARFYVRATDWLMEQGIRGDALREHPVTVLIAHKLADLSGVASFADEKYFDAYSECSAMAAIADELDAVTDAA